MYRTTKINKEQVLLEQGKSIFTTTDLAVLWEIDNQNTLLKTLSRYESKGTLKRLAKGVYTKKKIEDLHPFEIGCAIGGAYSYISAESILAQSGIIMQEVTEVTMFGKVTKVFEINNIKYSVRYLNPKYLLNRIGINYKDNYYAASLLRAVADIQHIVKVIIW